MNCTRGSKVVAVLAALMSLAALAEPRTWVGDETTHCGSWGTPGNWSPTGCPQEGDDVTIPDYGCDMTIDVAGEQKARRLYIDYRTDYSSESVAADKVTFTGSGKLTFVTSGSDVHQLRTKRHVVVSGPDLSLGGQVTYIYGTLEVVGGSTVDTVDKSLYLWTADSALIVDGGIVNVGASLAFNSTGVSPCLIRVKSGALNIPVWLSDDGTMPYNLMIEGGKVQVANFKLLNTGSLLTLSAGELWINFPSAANVNADLLHATGGKLVYGKKTTTDIKLAESGLVNIPGVTTEVIGNFVFTNGFTLAGNDPFLVTALKLGDLDHPANISRGTVVFDGVKAFIRNGNQRTFNVEGPTVFRGRADMPRSGDNAYVQCYGPLTIDTRDWTDPSVRRSLYFQGISSGAGSLELTVKGGGSAAIVPAFTYNSCKSVVVEEGTTLELAPRGNSSEWGHMNAESLTLGPNSVLKMEAGKNFMQASSWNVDSTAKISVDAASFTVGAAAILLDSDGDDIPAAVLARVEVLNQPAGSELVNERGQLTLRKDHSEEEIGKWGAYEWTGEGTDAKTKTDANWFGQSAPAEKTDLFAGASLKNAIAYNGFSSGGTLGSMTFADNATRTYDLSRDSGTLTVSGSRIVNKSSVPQVVSADVRVNGTFELWGGDAPLVYDSYQFSQATTPSVGVLNVCGDARVKSTYWRTLEMKALQFTSYAYPASASRFTLQRDPADKGDTLFRFIGQSQAFEGVGAGFRVCEGAHVSFARATGAKLQWQNDSQCNIINGTLDIDVPIYGCGNQFYGGHGTVAITNDDIVTTYGAARNCRVYFQDSLDVLLNDWNTVTVQRDADLAVALGARGTPVLHVKDGWTYGPEHGVTTATDPDVRAFKVERGAVATIDPDGGAATFNDRIIGAGTLAIANGTLNLAATSANTAGISVDADSTLVVTGATDVRSVVGEAGATIRLVDGGYLVASGACDLNGVNVVPSVPVTGKWVTYLVLKEGASVSGTPVLPTGVKTRTCEVSDGTAYQFREGGLVLLFR